MFSSVPSGNWGPSLQRSLISCKFCFKKEKEGSEGVNLFALILSASLLTLTVHSSFLWDEDKKHKEREEQLKVLTNDLINGSWDYRLAARWEGKWACKFLLKAVNKCSVEWSMRRLCFCAGWMLGDVIKKCLKRYSRCMEQIRADVQPKKQQQGLNISNQVKSKHFCGTFKVMFKFLLYFTVV